MPYKKDNLVVFVTGILFATLVALSIIPGLDFLAWHLLQPAGFYQRLLLVAIEAFTAVPRGFLAFFLFIGIAKLTVEVV